MEERKNLLQLQKESDNKPFPVLLGKMKRFLQQQAQDEKKNSLHAHVKDVLKKHCVETGFDESKDYYSA